MKHRSPIKLDELDRLLSGRLVVSCQPVDDGPMDRDDIVVQLALAACAGGAGAVRIAGAARVAGVSAAFAGKISAPIIGIIKRDLTDSSVVAVDGTERTRPATREVLLAAIREGGAIAMSDCSSLNDALSAHALGFDIIGTTLSGYTSDGIDGKTPVEPDYDFVAALAKRVPRVMAEGRFNRPDQAVRALNLGAWAVTVGTAITRTEIITSWFAEAIKTRK
jgi:N-acylglucosamine-6-phosphate 2-epimerase